jgi:hypothetical protein
MPNYNLWSHNSDVDIQRDDGVAIPPKAYSPQRLARSLHDHLPCLYGARESDHPKSLRS